MSYTDDPDSPVKPAPPARPPAANALKHGFRASRYLDPAILAASEAIRADLVTIHEPDSDEETDLLEDLAIARARFDAIQHAFDAHHAHNRKHAREEFEAQGRKRLKSDILDLNAYPTFFFDPLSQTFEGIRWIVGKWSEFVRSLAPDRPGITYEQAMFACCALGSHWSIPQMNGQGAWVMTRFVKDSLEPHVELNRWVQDSGGPTDLSRAKWYLDRAPDRATCRQELLTEAQTQLDRWTMRLNELRPDYETEAATAAERVLAGMPGGPDPSGRLPVPIRYLSEARCHVDRLQRRLDALKKSRPMNRHRAARKAEREARQQLRESGQNPGVQPEAPPQPAGPGSAETISNAVFTPISPNGTIEPGTSAFLLEPGHEPADPDDLRPTAAIEEDAAFECPFDFEDSANAAADVTAIALEMPSPELADFCGAETGNPAEAYFDFEFDDEAETVLDIDYEALAKAGREAAEASEEPTAIESQDVSNSADTPISPNGPATLPAADKELFDRVSDPRIPLADRIGWLAQRLGVSFEIDLGFDDDDDDDSPPMTPRERREFEAW